MTAKGCPIIEMDKGSYLQESLNLASGFYWFYVCGTDHVFVGPFYTEAEAEEDWKRRNS